MEMRNADVVPMTPECADGLFHHTFHRELAWSGNMTEWTRRGVLGGFGTVTAASLAGCSGGSGSNDSGSNDDSGSVDDGSIDDSGSDDPVAARTGTAWPTYRATPQNNPWLTDTAGPDGTIEHAWELTAHYANPAVVDGVAYVDRAEEIAAVDVASGEIQWTYAAENDWSMTPTLLDGTLYTFDRNGITAIDSASGEHRWTDDAIGGGSLHPYDGVLYGVNTTNAYAFDPASREVRWTADLPGENPDWNSIEGTAVDGDHVYMLAVSGSFVAFDRESGEVQWSRKFSTSSVQTGGLNVGGNGVYLHQVPRTSHVRAMDPATGADRWKKSVSSGNSTPVVTADGLYLIEYRSDDQSFSLGQYDPVSGDQTNSFDAVSRDFGHQPVVAGERLYHWSDAETLTAVDLANDEVAWTYEHDREADGLPVVTPEAVLFREDTTLHCLQSA